MGEMFSSTTWWSRRFAGDEARTEVPSYLTQAQPMRRKTWSVGNLFVQAMFRVTRTTLTYIAGPGDLATLVVLRWSPYPVSGRSMRPVSGQPHRWSPLSGLN